MTYKPKLKTTDIVLPANHITYTSSQDIKAICSPIIRHFNILHFNYVRLFNSGVSIRLTMNPDWVEFFYKKYSYYLNNDGLTEFSHHKSFFASYSQLDEKLIFEDLAAQFKIVTGLVIVEKKQDYTEFFFYGSPDKTKATEITLLNSIDLLKHFNTYFLAKAKDILLSANGQPIKLPKQSIENDRFSFVNYSNSNYDKFDFLNEIDCYANKTTLTKREQCCAYHIRNGLTAKEIARLLGISHRTVEVYIERLKKRLNCRNKTELIKTLLTTYESY